MLIRRFDCTKEDVLLVIGGCFSSTIRGLKFKKVKGKES
jgi:hypothetical protein